MKCVIDDKIPYIKNVFEPFGPVVYLPGAKTTADVVKDADVIITRTRTICNEKLLSGSTVKLIATATIGYDHIDTDYCDNHNIVWTNAPGCNSKSVEQYIASVLFVLADKHHFSLKDKTIGIVGVGQVGSKVAKICSVFGMKVLLNDPPRERKEGCEGFVSLDTIVEQADIISLHVPLNEGGEDATFHLADVHFFNQLKRKPFLINSCRGEVLDTEAAKKAVEMGKISGIVVDCWENEPQIDLALLKMTDIATPHIAGYSKDGKANGTSMCVQYISRFFNLGLDSWVAQGVEKPNPSVIEIDGSGKSEQDILSEAVWATYDVRQDDVRFRAQIELFEQLRGDYPLRREFTAYSVVAEQVSAAVIQTLETLGFVIIKK